MPMPRKSNEAHIAQGTYNSTKHGIDAPMASGELVPPDNMTALAKRLFYQYATILTQKGLSFKEYSEALSIMCTGMVERDQLRKSLKKQGGSTYTDKNGVIRANPTHKMIMEKENMVLGILKSFGLTPDTKSKVASSKEATNLGVTKEDFFV